jgi:hypothetical protein
MGCEQATPLIAPRELASRSVIHLDPEDNRPQLVITGRLATLPNGRTVALEPEMAARLHELATHDAEIRALHQRLAPRWRAAGLPSLGQARARAAESRSHREASRYGAKVVPAQALAAIESEPPTSCLDLELGIYELTEDYYEQVNHHLYYMELVEECMVQSTECTSLLSSATTWFTLAEWSRTWLEVKAGLWHDYDCLNRANQ